MINTFLKYSSKNLFNLILMPTILATIFVTSANSQELTLPNNDKIEASELPFYKNRPKVLDFLTRVNGQMAVASPPEFCPSYSYTTWNRSNLEWAINKCDKKLEKRFKDYTEEFRKRCACEFVVKNKVILDFKFLKNKHKWATIKIYFKSKEGKVSNVRGVLEFEVSELRKQNIRVLNQNLEEFCVGTMRPAFDDSGEFDLTCVDGTRHAAGKVTLQGFSNMHTIGSGYFDDGVVFAFLAGLTDSEINEEYPNFPDVSVKKDDEEENQN